MYLRYSKYCVPSQMERRSTNNKKSKSHHDIENQDSSVQNHKKEVRVWKDNTFQTNQRTLKFYCLILFIWFMPFRPLHPLLQTLEENTVFSNLKLQLYLKKKNKKLLYFRKLILHYCNILYDRNKKKYESRSLQYNYSSGAD